MNVQARFNRSPKNRSQGVTYLILATILLLSAVLRLADRSWDGGYYAHPDELHIVNVTTDRLHLPDRWADALFPDRSELNPRRLHPDGVSHYSYSYGTLLVYSLKAVSNVVAVLFGERFATTDSILIVARTMSALADVAAVLALFLVGRRLFDARVGLLAAAFAGLTVIQIQNAHFYVAEPFMVMFLTFALYALIRTLQERRLRWAGATGLLLGLAVATKPSAAAFLPAVGLITLWQPGPALTDAGRRRSFPARLGRGVRMLTIMAPAALVAWAVFEPYAVLDLRTYIENVVAESRIQRGITDMPYTRQYIGSVPGWYHLTQYARWSVGLPLGLTVALALVFAVIAALRRRSARHGVLLAWMLPYTYAILDLEAKWLRYMLPLSPVLVLLAAALLWRWYDSVHVLAVKGRFAAARALLPATAMVVILVGTGLWAAAFMRVYAGDHTWVAASRWLYANAPAGAVIGTEHWDRQLPIQLPGSDAARFGTYNIAMYDDLAPAEKLDQVRETLRSSDYIVLASNRLYDSIPRSPWRYPVATRYYDLLFEERLGFERVHVVRKAPSLGRLPAADQRADESFTVYDHPTVTIYRKVRDLQNWEYSALFNDAVLAEWRPVRHSAPGKSLLLDSTRSPAAQGWRYFDGSGLTGWTAAGAWLLTLEMIGLIGWLLCRRALQGLPDGGWAAGKVVGLALVAWLSWIVPSIGLVPSHAGTTVVCLGLLAGLAGILTLRFREGAEAQVRARWRTMLGFESLFLTLFAGYCLLRSANPDMWQPYWGGEKPMELAFINGVLRSSALPPYDPWFSGGYINYYYYGQWIAATLMRLSSVGPQYGFNLALASVFALTGLTAASVGYYTASAWRTWARVLVGGITLVFVLILGNLASVGQLWRSLRTGVEFHFWDSTRVIPGTINEFPFFTFLYGDLHAHMIALPLGLAVLLLAVYLFLDERTSFRQELQIAALAGLLTGAAAVTNPWDAPGYGGMFLLALVGRLARNRGGLVSKGVRLVAAGGLFGGVAALAYAPFFASFKSFYSEVGLVADPTPLPEFLTVLGLYLFIPALYAVVRLHRGSRDRRALAAALIVVLFATWRGRAVLGILLGLLLLMLYSAWRARDSRHEQVWLGLTAAGLAVWAGIETVYLKDFLQGGDWYRMNTVFKFGLQSWVLLALGCAGLLFATVRQLHGRLPRFAASSLVSVLLVGSLIYPVFGTASRLRQRFPEPPPGRTLDGEAFLRTATLSDESGAVELFRYDYEAVLWLRESVPTPETIVEASIGPYRGNGGRISMFTGLPTLVGWDSHESQQRYPEPVSERNTQVRVLYNSPDPLDALRVISRYGVRYIYVGPVERQHEFTFDGQPEPYASREGVAKFEAMVGETLDVAYRNAGVTIYKVRPSTQWPASALSADADG